MTPPGVGAAGEAKGCPAAAAGLKVEEATVEEEEEEEEEAKEEEKERKEGKEESAALYLITRTPILGYGEKKDTSVNPPKR